MKIDFLIWNGKQYFLVDHDWILDEISVIRSGVTVKLQAKPKVFTGTCTRCQKKHTAETKEQCEMNVLQCDHLPEKKP